MLDADLTTLQLVWREAPDRFRARDPFPVGGVVEDPATGAAAAALGRVPARARRDRRAGLVRDRPGRRDGPAEPDHRVDRAGRGRRPRLGQRRPDLTRLDRDRQSSRSARWAGRSRRRASRSASISARSPASSASIVAVGTLRRHGCRRAAAAAVVLAEVDRRHEDAGQDAGQGADDPDAGEHDRPHRSAARASSPGTCRRSPPS